MKFVICEALPNSSPAQKQYQWLYVVENGRVQVGDVVRDPWGYNGNEWLTVTAVGTTRAQVGSEYTGAVKVIERVEKPEIAAAVKAIHRAEITLAQRRAKLRELRGLDDRKLANLKTMYGSVKVSAPRLNRTQRQAIPSASDLFR